MKKVFLFLLTTLFLFSCSDSKNKEVAINTIRSSIREHLIFPDCYRELHAEAVESYLPPFLTQKVMGNTNTAMRYCYTGEEKEKYLQNPLIRSYIKEACIEHVNSIRPKKFLGLVDPNPRYYVVMIKAQIKDSRGNMQLSKFIGLVSKSDPSKRIAWYILDPYFKQNYQTEREIMKELASRDPDRADLYATDPAFDKFILED